MVHFEVKIYHHKVASFKDVCMVVVMVGDKAQNYLPSSPLPPPNNSFKSSCRYFGGSKNKFPIAGHKRTAKCVQVKVVTMDSIFLKLLS